MDTVNTYDNTIRTTSNELSQLKMVDLKDLGDDVDIDPNKYYSNHIQNNLKLLCEKIYSAK